VPIIVWGSKLVIMLMDRFPIVITLGGMLLGWIAGSMIVTDPVLKDYLAAHEWVSIAAPVAGALFVLAVGKWRASRMVVHEAVEEVVEADQQEEARERREGKAAG